METTQADVASKPLSATARIAWALLILATLFVCYFSHLGTLGFVGPDEPRYAWIARDMAESGDWVTPRLYGKPWFEKPPLFYWAAALSFKLFGVSEAAARLPSAVSALLATLAVAWLALRLYGAETARWLLLLLPTTVGMIGFSHAAATDMPFSAMLTIAMVFAAVILRLVPPSSTASPEVSASPIVSARSSTSSNSFTSFTSFLFFGLFLGLAVLAKGPAALVLSGGAVFFWAIFTRRWRDALRLLHPVAIASFCLTALPWYILCARRNADFFRIFIIEHNFKRYLTPEFQHIQPFWYYVPIVLVGLLPWTLIPLGVGRHGLSIFRNSPSSLFFWCASLFPLLFFSLSKSKLPGYILPAIPFLAFFLARMVSMSERGLAPGGLWIPAISGVTLFGLGLVAFINNIERFPHSWVPAVLTCGGLASAALANLRRFSFALGVTQVAVLLSAYLALSGNVGAALDSSVSTRYAFCSAGSIWNDYSPDRAAAFKLRRSFQYSLNFYFHREVPEWAPGPGPSKWIFTSRAEASELREMGLDCRFSSPIRAVIVCEKPASPDTGSGSGQL